MTATLGESQADLRRLVEMASRGEDVVITVDGKPKAKLTRAEGFPSDATQANPAAMAAWHKELEALRQKFSTGKVGSTVDQILAEDRADRI